MVRQPEKPKYVYRVVRRNRRRDDAVYWYSAPPGLERVPIPHPFMSDAFIAFAKARNKQSQTVTTPPAPGTLLQLADQYRGLPIVGVTPSKAQAKRDPVRYVVGRPQQVEASQEWLDLEPRTRKDYTKHVDTLLALWGGELVADIEVEACVELRDARRKTPRVANYLLNVFSSMLKIALQRKRTFGITENVATKVTRLGVKAGVRPRKAYWTYQAEIDFLADADRADPVVALGERLLAFTGQRPSDVRAMMLTDYDGEKIRVVQGKTGVRVWIRCHKDLKPHLDAALAEARSAGIVNAPFLRGVRGKGMGERYFATRWDAVASRTGTMHLNRQDLRRTAVIRLAEAECTVPQIAAITGHSLRQVETIMETYFVRTYAMGEAAIAKLERHQDRLKDERS